MVDGQLAVDKEALTRMSNAEVELLARTGFEIAGAAYKELRQRKAWKDSGYRKQDEYWAEVFGVSKSYVHRQIKAFELLLNIKTLPIGNVLPHKESHARPLAGLDNETQKQVWKESVDTAPNGEVTASWIEKTAEKYKNSKKEPVHFSSESDEHLTPSHILDAVTDCLGSIDLDPCSNLGEPNVKATYHHTVEDDGLAHPWFGRIYMNPPYGKTIGAWVDKLCSEHKAGNTVEAIALVPARTDTKWWIALRDYPACFIKGRLSFSDSPNTAPFPSALFYMGNHIDRFYYSFCDLGDIWQRIEPGMFGE